MTGLIRNTGLQELAANELDPLSSIACDGEGRLLTNNSIAVNDEGGWLTRTDTFVNVNWTTLPNGFPALAAPGAGFAYAIRFLGASYSSGDAGIFEFGSANANNPQNFNIYDFALSSANPRFETRFNKNDYWITQEDEIFYFWAFANPQGTYVSNIEYKIISV